METLDVNNGFIENHVKDLELVLMQLLIHRLFSVARVLLFYPQQKE